MHILKLTPCTAVEVPVIDSCAKGYTRPVPGPNMGRAQSSITYRLLRLRCTGQGGSRDMVERGAERRRTKKRKGIQRGSRNWPGRAGRRCRRARSSQAARCSPKSQSTGLRDRRRRSIARATQSPMHNDVRCLSYATEYPATRLWAS